jgi:hypothetical protein
MSRMPMFTKSGVSYVVLKRCLVHSDKTVEFGYYHLWASLSVLLQRLESTFFL